MIKHFDGVQKDLHGLVSCVYPNHDDSTPTRKIVNTNVKFY